MRMTPQQRVYVAGHRGMVGAALIRGLVQRGYETLLCRTRAELDLCVQADVEQFFAAERPEVVIIAAATSSPGRWCGSWRWS